MKHLRVLEDANLVLTRRVGRERFHYLNPVPIREIYERWVSKYADSWVSGLSEVKSRAAVAGYVRDHPDADRLQADRCSR